MQDPFHIGNWLVEPELNRVTKKRQAQALEPRLMRLLVLLAETPRQLVSKEVIFEEVWAGLSVTDESLSQAISKLRKLLDDDNDSSSHIETIRKKGYRLIVDVAPAKTSKKPSGNRLPQVAVLILAIGAIALYFALRTPLEAPPATSDRLLVSLPLSTSPGRERDPALSGDGEFVVYSRQTEDGEQHIFLHGIGRGAADRKLTSQAQNYAPAVIPGASAVAFLRRRGNDCTVILSSLIDGAERVIGNCTGSSYSDTATSPGGHTIAFSARAGGAEHAIFTLDIGTGEQKQVTMPPHGIWGDYDPVFSSDGASLYFARSVSEAMQDVYKVDLQSGTEDRLTGDGRNVMGITLAGEDILFASNRDGRYAIWSMKEDGSSLTRLPISQTGIINPTSTPVGDRLAFEAIRRVVTLQMLEPSLSEKRKDLLQFNAELLHPAIDPTGARFVFSSDRSGFFEIWEAGIDGGTLQRLTDFRSGFTAHPRYSPDGSKIAFDARPESQSQIFLVDRDGGNLTTVTSADGFNRYAPTWSPDGQSVIYARETEGRLELWKTDLADNIETRLTHSGGTFGYLNSNGTLYHTRPNIDGIWQLAPGETQPGLVLPGLMFSDWGNWALENDQIRFYDRPNNALKTLNMADQSMRIDTTVEGLVPTADPAVAFISGGQSALVTIRHRLESDIEFVNLGPPPSK